VNSSNDKLIKVLRSNLRAALRQGSPSQAADIIARLKEEDPLALQTRGLELEYLIAVGQWKQARSLALQLLDLHPDSARIHYLAARVHYHDRSYSQALHHFRESERLHPHWLTRRWLGKTQTQLGQYGHAEAMLLGLLSEHPQVNLDLAWLYERREQPQQALKYVQDYLDFRPDDEFAQTQRRRLRSVSLGAEELVVEVDTLLELDEEIPAEMLSVYVQRLLETGQGAEARRFIARHGADWDPKEAASVAWICHRLQAYDLALQLFLSGLPVSTGNYKYLSALESAAVHCMRVDDVLDAYERLAPQDKRLYGRMKSLAKRREE
jgi:tetratricopeptide (TPR) repeat protein